MCAFEGIDEEEALQYLKQIYGASITTSDELMAPSESRLPVGAAR